VVAQRTYMAKTGQVSQQWWHVDATGQVVGRLATQIAVYLMGKHRATYTPHVDTGDFVVVTHAEKVVLTGKKWQLKTYNWFTGYRGLRSQSAAARLATAPEDILTEAVRRMLPKNKLGRKMLAKLKVYAGSDHPHQAQNPTALDLSVNQE
jgi:large subunit ribosomal protein L13